MMIFFVCVGLLRKKRKNLFLLLDFGSPFFFI